MTAAVACSEGYRLHKVRIVHGPIYGLPGLHMEVFACTSRDDDHAYLWHSGDHFNAVLWTDREAASRPGPPSGPHSGAPRNARAAVRISRELTNTVAGSQLLGVLTWNINHLGSQAQGKLSATLYHLQPRNERKPIYNEHQATAITGQGAEGTPLLTAKKLRALERIIDENCSWLDIIALQEVNLGDRVPRHHDHRSWRVAASRAAR
jgi:hypothetical protein